jgi:hypothetical protein
MIAIKKIFLEYNSKKCFKNYFSSNGVIEDLENIINNEKNRKDNTGSY